MSNAAKVIENDCLLLKQSFSMTLAAMEINLWRKSDLPLKRPCFRVSEKGCGFLIKPIYTGIVIFAILVF